MLVVLLSALHEVPAVTIGRCGEALKLGVEDAGHQGLRGFPPETDLGAASLLLDDSVDVEHREVHRDDDEADAGAHRDDE
jgi:hypothetical protein